LIFAPFVFPLNLGSPKLLVFNTYKDLGTPKKQQTYKTTSTLNPQQPTYAENYTAPKRAEQFS
jgi:hypothetical protein